MTLPAWELFFQKAVRQMLHSQARVLDIGAGLRIDASRGNVEDPKRAWMKPLVKEVTYKVMDPVDTYHPDIVGDIHAMPIADESYDAIFCLAVLEHVERPWVAISEMSRVLVSGGMLLVYVPFLSSYHAMPGYYGDFFRFTEDGIRSLFQDWEDVQLAAVRGPVETLAHLLPVSWASSFVGALARKLDRFRRSSGKQSSGYYVTARKH